LFERVAGNLGDVRAGQRLDVMIGFIEEHVLEVEGVARDMDRQDLARPAARQLVAKRVAVDQDGAAVGPVAFAQDVRLRLELAQLVGQAEDRRTILRRERIMALEFPDQQVQRMLLRNRVQINSPACWAGARYYLSVANAIVAADARGGNIGLDQRIDVEASLGTLNHRLQFQDAVKIQLSHPGG